MSQIGHSLGGFGGCNYWVCGFQSMRLQAKNAQPQPLRMHFTKAGGSIYYLMFPLDQTLDSLSHI